MSLRKAKRSSTYLKINVSGTSGSGKTMSSLLCAYGLIGDWEKIALIDSENGSGDLYTGSVIDDVKIGEYNIWSDFKGIYSPRNYTTAITDCYKAGMKAIIIDSATHEWEYCLEMQQKKGGRYQDWKDVTPEHNNFIKTILRCPAHIISTSRRKQDYAVEKEGDKTKVRKLGLKEVQREGYEYEFTVAFDINQEHLALASKDRTGLFSDPMPFQIGVDVGKRLKEWASGK